MPDPTPIVPVPSTSQTSKTTETPTSTSTTTTTSVTPGWKTSEFWVKIVALIVSTLLASGVIPTTGVWAQVTAIAVTILGAMGYTVGRSMVKAAALRGTMLVLMLLLASSCAPPVAAGVVAVGAITASGCAHNPILCGPNGHLVAPDWTACFEAIVSAGASIPGAIAACSVNLGSAACIEDILNAGSDLLVACKPTCATVGARLGAGTTVEISRSNLRVNMIEALRASGKYPNAGK